MRYRRDLWQDLQITTELALEGRSTPAAARTVSDRVRYLPPEGRDFIALNNTLKALTYVWQYASDETRPHIETALRSTCAALSALPVSEHITYFDAVGLRKVS